MASYYGRLTDDDLMQTQAGIVWQAGGVHSRWAQFSGTSLLVSGTMYYEMAPFRYGKTYTAAGLDVTVAASGLTLAKAAIISLDGTSVIATSATDHTAWNSGTGFKSTAFTSAYSPASDTVAYIVWIFVGTTPPTVGRGQGGWDPSTVGSNYRAYGTRTGQSDITAVGPNTVGGARPWMALI